MDAVLDGSIQSAAGRLRATVRLLRVSDGATLWAQAFDERLSDILPRVVDPARARPFANKWNVKHMVKEYQDAVDAQR